MAHTAILHLGTGTGMNRYEVLKMDYEFDQKLNLGPVHGAPWTQIGNAVPKMLGSWTTGEVTGGNINLTIATPPDSDTIFHRWMFSRWRPMSGHITVDMSSAHNQRRKLHIAFNNGYCTNLKDEFDSQNGEIMTTTIRISCQEIIIGANIPAVWPAFI